MSFRGTPSKALKYIPRTFPVIFRYRQDFIHIHRSALAFLFAWCSWRHVKMLMKTTSEVCIFFSSLRVIPKKFFKACGTEGSCDASIEPGEDMLRLTGAR
jgi:hypothetical protein